MNVSVVGFEYVEFNAKRNALVKGNIQIKNGISITSLENSNMSFVNEMSKVLKVGFKYTVDYTENIAKIGMSGYIYLLLEKKDANEVLRYWSKNKKLSEDLVALVMNQVMQKSTIEAISLSQKLNLPSPIPLPQVKIPPQTSQESTTNADNNKENKKNNSKKKTTSKKKN